jgi:hypothetical protein
MYLSSYKLGSPWNHEGFQTNQPTYKPISYKFSRHSHILHKVRNIIRIHRSLEYKVITNQIHNKVVEAISFETTHAHLVQIQWQIMIKSHKNSRWDIWTDHALSPSYCPSLGRDSWRSNHNTSDHLQQQWEQSPEYEDVLNRLKRK